jgi:hypothetical protein
VRLSFVGMVFFTKPPSSLLLLIFPLSPPFSLL